MIMPTVLIIAMPADGSPARVIVYDNGIRTAGTMDRTAAETIIDTASMQRASVTTTTLTGQPLGG